MGGKGRGGRSFTGKGDKGKKWHFFNEEKGYSRWSISQKARAANKDGIIKDDRNLSQNKGGKRVACFKWGTTRRDHEDGLYQYARKKRDTGSAK